MRKILTTCTLSAMLITGMFSPVAPAFAAESKAKVTSVDRNLPVRICHADLNTGEFIKAAAEFQQALAKQARATAKKWGGSDADVKDNIWTAENGLADNTYSKLFLQFNLQERYDITETEFNRRNNEQFNALSALASIPAANTEVYKAAERAKAPLSVGAFASALVAASIRAELAAPSGDNGAGGRTEAAASTLESDYLKKASELAHAYGSAMADVYNACAQAFDRPQDANFKVQTFIGSPIGDTSAPLATGSSILRFFRI